MTYETGDRDLVIITITGSLVWNEFYEALDYGRTYQRPSAVPYDVIVDLRGAHPASPDAIFQLRRAAAISEQIDGKIVLVTSNSLAATLFDVFIRIYPKIAHKYSLVRSLADARTAVGAPTIPMH